ncbi:MAG: molybdenum cofactor biosynthesis protein MoaE [Candidatus Eremiobacteraeota bacterium]|nr:molybdenum cofactor biosynthesis protein MoaE [Candidatus Eremiobacteraeota bacterium]
MFRIVGEPIDPRALEAVIGGSDGGVTTFLGVVRGDGEGGRAVRALWYEAFEGMALREFEAIGAEARHRFGDVRLAIVHRIGEIRVGDVSVAVLAAAPHRAAAFDACRYAIDELKRRAPIWKKEHYLEGDSEWRPTRA